MHFGTVVGIVGPDILTKIPMLLVWLAGIVLAVLMVRRGGGKPEKLFLAGCSSMFASTLVSSLMWGLVRWWMSEQDRFTVTIGQAMGWTTLTTAILSLVGVVCLVWAFWIRFWTKRREAA